MGKIITLIVGRSGSGKTTIVNELERKHGFKSVQSYTTRPKRTENETGHTFVTADKIPSKEQMVAFTVFDGNMYWATQEQVEDSDLYVIDPLGIDFFKEHYKGYKKIKIINILASERECFYRMIKRGDEPNKVEQRIKNDREVFNNIVADAHIVNNDLDKTVDMIYKLIQQWEREAE